MDERSGLSSYVIDSLKIDGGKPSVTYRISTGDAVNDDVIEQSINLWLIAEDEGDDVTGDFDDITSPVHVRGECDRMRIMIRIKCIYISIVNIIL